MVTQVCGEYTESRVDIAIHTVGWQIAGGSSILLHALFISLEVFSAAALVCAPCLSAQLQPRSLTASLNLLHCAFHALLSLTFHGCLYYSWLWPGKIGLKLPSEISQLHIRICTSVDSVCCWPHVQRLSHLLAMVSLKISFTVYTYSVYHIIITAVFIYVYKNLKLYSHNNYINIDKSSFLYYTCHINCIVIYFLYIVTWIWASVHAFHMYIHRASCNKMYVRMYVCTRISVNVKVLSLLNQNKSY